jgi:hypothetical protein
MALTLEKEQKLRSAGFIEFYENNTIRWRQMAQEVYQQVYDYYLPYFPNGSEIRRDDISKFLITMLGFDELFLEYLNKNREKNKISQISNKRWTEYFADLIIDRCWNSLFETDETANANHRRS